MFLEHFIFVFDFFFFLISGTVAKVTQWTMFGWP